jgi:hypothetical protein
MLILIIGVVPSSLHVSEAQQQIGGDIKFRGIVVDSSQYPMNCPFLFDVFFYCVRVEEIIYDPTNSLERGTVIQVRFGGMLGTHPNADQADVGDFVEVYAYCSLDVALDPAWICALRFDRDDHYIRRLSGQTATVTVTSTITSTVTRYTTVTSNTVTRTVTVTSTIYTTSTITVDVTSTRTSTQTVATTVTRTTATTTTETRDTTPPTVRVIAPNGGERLSPGSVFRIRWEASDNVGVTSVYIRLYQGGVMRMIIADNLPNTGYYDWTVPNRPGSDYKIVVIARDAAGNFGEDESDGTFEIVAVAQGTLQHFDLDYRGTPPNSDGNDQTMITVSPCSSLTLFFYYREGNTGNPYIIRVYPEWDKDRFIANSDNNEAAPEGERSREEGGFRWDVETYIVPCTPGTYKVRVVYRGSHTPPTWDSYDKLLAEGTIIVQAVAPSLPDLTVRDVSFSPQTVTQGGSITVSWTEVNIGSGSAGPYWVGIYLGLSEYGMDYLLGSFHRAGLAVGGSRGYTQTFTIPSNVPLGYYYVTVFIDSQGDV